jgi:hypothetical protein
MRGNDEQVLVHLHDVFVGVDPRDLGVDRDELGRVAGGERRVGAERRGNLEHLAEAGGLRHLLEELRALGEVGLRLEVLHLEELGAALRRRRHQLRGVDLDEAVLDPPGAQRVQERGLHPEDQVLLGATQVEEAPVEALVDARVVGDRRVEGRGDDVEFPDLDLEPAELHALVVLEFALDREEGAGRQPRDGVGDRGVALVALAHGGVDELSGARLVAEHDELHLLLIAHGVDPSGDPDGSFGEVREVGDQSARSHGDRV